MAFYMNMNLQWKLWIRNYTWHQKGIYFIQSKFPWSKSAASQQFESTEVETLTTDDCPLRMRSIVGAGESLGIITVVS